MRRCLTASFAICFLAFPFCRSIGLASSPTRLSVHAENEPVRVVLLRISRLYHVSITIDPDVHGYATLDLHDVTFAQAIGAIAESDNLDVHDDHGVLVVSERASSSPMSTGAAGPTVISLSILKAQRAAALVHNLFPDVAIRVDAPSNAIIITASDSDLATIRAVLQGLDIKDPARPTVESITLRTDSAANLQHRLAPLYPSAQITTAGKDALLIRASAIDMAQIKTVIASLDSPTATPPPTPASAEAVSVTQRRPSDIARAVSREISGVRAAVSGSTVVLVGVPDAVARAKTLIATLDVPPFGASYSAVYRLHNVEASSVAELIARSFAAATISTDKDLNAISVTANAADQQRIADAVSKLDGGGGTQPNDPGLITTAIVPLESVIPSQATGSSTTTPQDIANAVTQSLQTLGDLKVVVPNNALELIVSGSPTSVRKAEDLIAKLDVIPQSVVLDTEILELDETGSKNLGLQLSTGISSTFTEVSPPADPTTGLAGRISRLLPLTRTPLSFQATINLLLQSGSARVLANPRITTLSGRTASIRAGDTISILTTTGGGTGTVATTQLQSFQTGVQLDITPVVSKSGEVTVALHPVVNSLTAYNAGVPQISTRDAQTTVHLKDDETLVIGGLIQDSVQRTTNKVPLLGNLPLVGGAFRNDQVESTRNELVIVVTPHVVTSFDDKTMPGPPLPDAPRAQPLPTLPPGTTLPPFQFQGTPPTLPNARAATAQPTPAPTPLPTPLPLPSAFGQTNVFTYGSPPPNNSAASGDAATIYYASFQPTVLHSGSMVNVAVITSTNVRQVLIGPPGFTNAATQVGPGKWLAAYSFSMAGYPGGQTNIAVPIVASRSDGASTAVNVPVSLQP